MLEKLIELISNVPVAGAAKTKSIPDQIMDTCKVQSNWMKDAVYSWPKWNPKNVAQSKKAGTCVTYVACVLQRLGYLKSGQYIWHTGKGYGTGKVTGTNDKMTVTYMDNKTLKSLKSKLKKGDIVLVDDNKSGVEGSGGHIFILTGKWTKDGEPYIWDNETAKKGQKPRTYGANRKVLAIVRIKEPKPTPKPTPTEKSYSGNYPSTKKILKKGSKGTDVVRWQKYLDWYFDGKFVKECGKPDGIFGSNTHKWTKKFQEKEVGKGTGDGLVGPKTIAAAKKVKKQTKNSRIPELMDACRAQADWMKNYTYKWENNPTIPKSKKYGTCVTYVACVLQRLGILKSGDYIWIDSKGKVEGANSKVSVTYMKGTLKSNKDKFKKGDIIIGGNGNVHAASGSHIFVLTGKWDANGNPYIFDQASADRVKAGKNPMHTWPGSFPMIARIRLK